MVTQDSFNFFNNTGPFETRSHDKNLFNSCRLTLISHRIMSPPPESHFPHHPGVAIVDRELKHLLIDHFFLRTEFFPGLSQRQGDISF
jgi:hypothetical protein